MQKFYNLINNNYFIIISFFLFLFFSLNFHLYNVFNFYTYAAIFIISYSFLSYLFIKDFLKINRYLLIYFSLFLFLFLFYLYNFILSDITNIRLVTKIYFSYELLNYILFFYPFFFFFLILLFIPFFIKIDEETAKKFFLIVNIICLILLSITILFLLFNPILFNYVGHEGWARPFMYLFFFNDNDSSKLQHAYILFISSYFIFIDYFKEKTKSKTLFFLATINIFYLYLIFSFLFWGIILLLFLLLFLFSKNKILFLKKIFNLFTIFLVLVFLLSYTISLKYKFFNKSYQIENVEFSIIDVTLLKFAKIIYAIDFSKDKKLYYNIVIKNNVALKFMDNHYFKNINNPNLKIEKSINQINSTTDRVNKSLKCLNKKFLDANFFSKKFTNCESSVLNGSYLFGNIFILWFICFFLALFFQTKTNNESKIFYFLFLIISFFHHTFENTFGFLIISFFIANSIKRQTSNFS